MWRLKVAFKLFSNLQEEEKPKPISKRIEKTIKPNIRSQNSHHYKQSFVKPATFTEIKLLNIEKSIAYDVKLKAQHKTIKITNIKNIKYVKSARWDLCWDNDQQDKVGRSAKDCYTYRRGKGKWRVIIGRGEKKM